MTRTQKIHTVDTLKQHCVEIGDCWEWQRYIANNTPQVFHDGKMQPVRRVFTTLLGREMKPNSYAVPKCDNFRCVNPAHTVIHSHNQHMKAMSKAGNSNPMRNAKIQAYARTHRAKLTEEQVQDIRASTLPSREIGAMYGVSHGLVGKIRNGTAWRMMTSHPFAGLMR